MTALQRRVILDCPVHERAEFTTTVKSLIVAKAVKDYLATGEIKNMVNRVGVKKFILEWAKYTRHHPFNRVASYVPAEVNAKVRHTLTTMDPLPRSAKATVEELERVAKSHARSVVSRNPSLGKTLR